ncbi:class B sortase [Adlercreutzia sp. ZJ154]|uniref:class B sortase n=1 Tax=Adlercreutzia sp. ZJ154 TaxID=2709790 RepID=UPI0013EA8E16|nr:class B sortase [Adlercreutzia sp. ZJ154]
MVKRSYKIKAALGFSIAGLSFALLGCVLAWLLWCTNNSYTAPNPNFPEAQDAEGFPEIDWNYWQSVNPDVIGWVSIPGAELSCAIVQAPTDNPTYYLEHDIRGYANYHGCPYLDADCAELGLNSQNAVIFGHNIRNGNSMFATFANYSQEEFAQKHSIVLLQTPEWKKVLQISGASIVKGNQRTKRTSFNTQEDFNLWFSERLDECCVKLQDSIPSSCITFVTCSYNQYSNERTLVYAAVQSDK